MEKSRDFAEPFREIAPFLQRADLTIGNLEGPFCESPPYPAEGMTFRVRPTAIEALRFAGFDVMSAANNHMGDGGNACLEYTISHLASANILTVGSGKTYADAHAPAILVRHGVRFAFLGYTYADRNDFSESKLPVVAGRNPEYVKRDVAGALLKADAVIVSLHDGAEYTRRVAPETAEFARAAIDAGAVLVLGHHPHVAQRVEQYKHGWIFYSLGNFVFQQYTPPETQHALLARVTFAGARIERVEALPAVIQYHSRPRPASDKESLRILARIGLSGPNVYPPWPEGW
jgi:poly-gamma-glutamate synthesis protein (capsule biosynthesis protein)